MKTQAHIDSSEIITEIRAIYSFLTDGLVDRFDATGLVLHQAIRTAKKLDSATRDLIEEFDDALGGKPARKVVYDMSRDRLVEVLQIGMDASEALGNASILKTQDLSQLRNIPWTLKWGAYALAITYAAMFGLLHIKTGFWESALEIVLGVGLLTGTPLALFGVLLWLGKNRIPFFEWLINRNDAQRIRCSSRDPI